MAKTEASTLQVARPVSSYRELIALLSCAYVVAFIDRGLVATAGASLQLDLHLTDTQFGLLSGPAFVTFFCLCGVPLGWLADRTSRQAVIAIGMCIWSLMTAACAFTSSFGGFFAARLGVGLGEACLVPAALSMIRSATSSSKLAQSVGIFLMGAAVGNAVALIGGGEFIGHASSVTGGILGIGGVAPWRALFVLSAVPGLILAAFIMRLRVRPRAPSIASLPLALRGACSLLNMQRSAYIWLTISTTCIIVLSQTSVAWMPLWYVRHFGLSPGQSAIVVGLLFVMSAPTGQWLGGTFIDRVRSRGVPAAPHVIQAGSALLCLPFAWVFCSSSSLAISSSSYIIFNVLIFAATPAGMTGWQLITPQRTQGLTIALLVAAVTMAGIGLGQSTVGMLSDTTRDLGSALFVTMLAASLVGSICAMLGVPGFIKASKQRSANGEKVSLDDQLLAREMLENT